MTIWYAGVVTLVGAIAIAAITSWLIASTQVVESAETVIARFYRFRTRYFFLLALALVIMLWVTLPKMPYRNMVSVEPEYIVPVTGKIWSWEIGPVRDRDGNLLQAEGEALALPVGQAVEFQVTAEDVNHGFGIYNQAGQMVAQTQAMPGYSNNLVHTFTAPGAYQILCMEYCGLAHHTMVTTITVE
jgi:cytochrome c oxidase subunit 2